MLFLLQIKHLFEMYTSIKLNSFLKHKLLFSKRMTKELFVVLDYSSDDVWILYNQGTATFGKKSDIYKKGN